MNKADIQVKLLSSHQSFLADIGVLDEAEAHLSVHGKWTPTQQLEHIVKSVSPVVLAFGLPSFFLRLLFGKANRPSRTYDELVARYNQKLGQGGKSPAPFIPAGKMDRARLSQRLKDLVATLIARMNQIPESRLDEQIIPHPLLGKLTFREMLYFTNHHVGHHHQQVVQHLAQSKKPNEV